MTFYAPLHTRPTTLQCMWTPRIPMFVRERLPIDLAVVVKDTDGSVAILEMQELSPEVAAAFVNLEGAVSGLLSEADLDTVAEALEPGNTAAALLFEHVWATRFAEAVRAADGKLVLSERIPHAMVAEARASLLAAVQ